MVELTEDIMLRRHQSNKNWFDNLVAQRDGRTCRKCGATKSVHAHNITPRKELPKFGNSIYNAVMLCHECRHIAGLGKNECYTPEVLYALIGSSLEKTIEDLKPRKVKPNDE